MIQWVEWARDEALVKAQFFYGVLEEEREGNAEVFQWIQGHWAIGMEEVLAMKG